MLDDSDFFVRNNGTGQRSTVVCQRDRSTQIAASNNIVSAPKPSLCVSARSKKTVVGYAV